MATVDATPHYHLRACEIPRSVSKTVNNSFHFGFTTEKTATALAEMMSVQCVAIFWFANASSGETSYLQFSIPIGSGVGGEGGISHCLKAMCHTDALLWSARKIASMTLPAEQERHAKNVWHIALRMFDCGIRVKNEIKINFITVVTNYMHY